MFSGRRLRKKITERKEREAQQRELLKRQEEEKRQRQGEERQRQQKLRRHREEGRQNQIELARQTQLQLTVGVPISVRRVNNFGQFSKGALDELTDAILWQTKQVKQWFFESFPNTKISHIEYILNDKLYKQFEKTRNQLRRLDRNYNELLLFHGTHASNVDRDALLM